LADSTVEKSGCGGELRLGFELRFGFVFAAGEIFGVIEIARTSIP
jgi:hypothetical protein